LIEKTQRQVRNKEKPAERIIFILYHFFATLILIFLFPALYPLRNRFRLKERLALRVPSLGEPVAARLWIHALSVGEVLSAIPLLEALKHEYPSREVVLSVKTETGLDIARQRLGGTIDYLVPMPLDFWWSVKRIMDIVQPALFILVETDIWPGLIGLLHRRGIKTILVNGRISPRTERYYARWRFVVKRVLCKLEACLVQTEIDRQRFMKGGITPDRVKVTGNIKFDRQWTSMTNRERQRWLSLFGFKGCIIWVAGSTHSPEEVIILNVFGELLHSFPNFALIIGPREAGRFDEVYELARGNGFKVIRRSELKARHHKCNVVILNTLGELGQVYGLSDVAFVGGSLAKRGGHNLLEPASFGIPVLFGPHTYNFTAMAESLIGHGGGKMVMNESELLRSMAALLGDRDEMERMGKRARGFVQHNQGALNRVMGILKPYIEIK
jgi:3-deoxy-D-manno-octulosonic-acid transferase